MDEETEELTAADILAPLPYEPSDSPAAHKNVDEDSDE